MHERVHAHGYSTKFCHYYNNSTFCPYKKFGRKFRHSNAEICKFDKACKRKLCPLKHDVMQPGTSWESNIKTRNINRDTINQSERDCEKEKEQNLGCNRVMEISSRSIVSSAEERYENGKALYCKKIRSEKYNIHVHEKDDVTTYKGVQMPAIEEDKSNRFIKFFPV